MPEQKMFSSREQKLEAAQGEMQTCQQHYGMKLTEQETSSVVSKALDNLKSPSTPSEVRAAVGKQMFALLAKKDPGRAAQFSKGAPKEKGERPAQKKEKQ